MHADENCLWQTLCPFNVLKFSLKYGLIWLCTILYCSASAQYVIKVQFIHGSKPKKEYRQTEKKWFGGVMGGHTGIEINPDQFLSFEGNDRFHPIDHSKKRHCR